MKPMPADGGSYRRNPDGSLTQLAPTTGERPCKCRAHAPRPKAKTAPVEMEAPPDPVQPDQTQPDQTQPDQTQPDQPTSRRRTNRATTQE